MGNFPTLFEDSNLSGLPASNPGSGRPWLDSSGAIIVGAAFSLATSDITGLDAALAAKADLVGGLVPSAQLPSYVDDVIEAANFAALPASGETGKIYLTLDDSRTYRWSGSAYVELTDATAVWGSISGTLANQTDLQAALDAKASSAHTHAASDIVSGTIATARLGSGTANASSYLRGDQTWATITTGAAWGAITGTLSSQTDLQTALDAKLPLTGGTLTGALAGTSATWSGNVTVTNAVLLKGSSNTLLVRNTADSAYGSASLAQFQANSLTIHSSTALVGSVGSIFGQSGRLLIQNSAASGDVYIGNSSASNTTGSLHLQGGGTNNVIVGASSVTVAVAAAFSSTVSLGPYTFATLPSASANSGKCLRITDRGQKHAYSDGTNWLFVHDNSVVV